MTLLGGRITDFDAALNGLSFPQNMLADVRRFAASRLSRCCNSTKALLV